MSKPIKKKITSAKNLVEDQLMGDGYNNFTAKLGLNTENLSSIATYTLGNLISRNHVQLESIYRTSWIAGQVIDTVAEDMTKEGIMMMSKLSPDDIQKMSASLTELGIWQKLCSTIKWARLYGGAIAVMLIDGADYTKPFDVTKVRKDSFKGLAVFDRWQLEPSYNELVTELGPDMGKPKFYTILPAMETMSTIKVHYSRVVRLEGIEMPYYQKKYDNLWGMSVIERMLDRLMAFDSATQGAAQLIYKAHLRVVQIDGLRQALAMGGKTESAVIKQFQYIRLMQSNEGITLLDKNDTFTPHSYTFAGLAEMLIQFGQQISGAVNIPLVRLFGQSPSGFNSGEADLRNYYDNVGKLQETMLRMPVHKILETLCMSVNGKPLPDDFEFDFNSLWQPSEVEKSQIVNNDVSALNIAFQSGMITKKIAMKELAQNSHVTGRFSNITDEDIEKAEEEPPEHQGMGSGLGGEENQEVDLKGLQEKIGQEPEPEADDTIGEKSLEDLEAELNELDGGGEKSLEDLEKELSNLDPPSLEQLEKELSKLGPEPTIEELETILKNIKTNFDPELMQLEKQLEEIDTSTPATPPKKMTTDNRGVLAKAWGSVKGFFTGDKQIHAPKGGVTVKGKKFKGGEFIPTAGGYATEYKKMQKKSSSSKQQSNKQGSSKSQKASSKVDKEKLAMLKTKLKKMSIQEGTRRTVKTADFLHAKRSDDGKVVMSNGKSLPKHLAKTSIPPMWKNLLINPDKDGKCWVIAFDENGKRVGGVYNPDHVAERDVKKDAMLNDLNKNLHTIYKQIDEGQKSKETFQKALITKVLALTGARVGSNEEALSPKGKSYGASTLEGRHIIPQKDGSIKLQFDGKGLKQNIYEVKDKHTASTLLKLKQKVGDKGRLFGEKYNDILGYVKDLDGGGFTPHNFRTKIATDTAMATIASMDPPTNLKEYKKAMKLVAIAVGEKLNDTPATVLKNYIVSSVWADWKSKAGIE
jgi:phage-related protein (TIGR01555 family)